MPPPSKKNIEAYHVNGEVEAEDDIEYAYDHHASYKGPVGYVQA
jgi:hypothetical protein